MSQVQPAALPPGSRVAEYEIVRVLGAGGFGITYLAFDHQLDGPVALKEYFPADVATRADGSGVAATATTNQDLFAWGLDRFIKEARAIHRLRHPNVVRAHRYLEANGTAYIVLEYVEGEPLKAILDRRGRLSADEWRPWMNALLDGLAHIHAHGYLHRDIKPANIVVRSDNGEPVLIDFGSARLQHGDRTLTQVLTAGYAPIEQYSNDAAQGPQGDIYAMAAVSYRVLTGRTVPTAPDRVLNDDYEPLAEARADADSRWLTAIDRGLALRPQDRPQTVEEWRAVLGTGDDTGTGVATPQPAQTRANAATTQPPEPEAAMPETSSSPGAAPATSGSAPAGGSTGSSSDLPEDLVAYAALLLLKDPNGGTGAEHGSTRVGLALSKDPIANEPPREVAERIVAEARARMATDAAWRRKVEKQRESDNTFNVGCRIFAAASLVFLFFLFFLWIFIFMVSSW